MNVTGKIKCSACKVRFAYIGIEGTLPPSGYTCNECNYKAGVDHPFASRVLVLQDWHELHGEGCAQCGTTTWGIQVRLTAPVEMTDVRDGDRELWLEGTVGMYTECPNPDCAFAWGKRASSDNVVERMPLFIPPWAKVPTKKLSELGLAKYMKLQTEAHQAWWDLRLVGLRRS